MPLRSVGRRNDDGTWDLSFRKGSVYPAYAEVLQVCLDTFDRLFCKAKATTEFEFVHALIRVTETKGIGWDSWETLGHVFDLHTRFNTRWSRDDEDSTHFSLFLYGLILEASEPYEMLANLLNVIEGERVKHTNFPYSRDHRERWRAQHFMTKIAQLRSRAKRVDVDLSFFDRFVDNNLRNAVFHSDYSIHWPKIRIVNPPKEFSHAEWMTRLNGALAYFEALRKVHAVHVGLYARPTIIDVNPAFSGVEGEKAITIVRKGHGLIGMRSHYSREELAAGAIPFQLARMLPYEVRMIDAGRLLLPPNRIERFNWWIRPLPAAIRRRIVKLSKKRFSR